MADAASTPIVDNLFRVYLWIGFALAMLVFLYLVYTAWRFRARDGTDPVDAPRADETPPDRGHPYVVFGTVITVGIILFGLSVGTLSTHDFLEHPPEDVSLEVDVTAFQFGWIFTYPQGFQTFTELRVPANEPILLHLTSPDVMHKFHIADYNIGIDAIPGRTTHLWFNASGPGVAQIRCAELCGIGHARMLGTVAAVPRAEFDDWVQAQLAAQPMSGFVQVLDLNVTENGPVPDRLQAIAGGEIHLRIANNATTPTGFRVGGPFNVSAPAIAPGALAWLNFSAPAAAIATFEAANDTGSRVGTAGTLTVVESQRISVSLNEWTVIATARTAEREDPILFVAKNDGQIVHDLTVGHWDQNPDSRAIQGRTPQLTSGKSASFAFFPQTTGKFDLWCNIPGHSEAGMRTTLEVVN